MKESEILNEDKIDSLEKLKYSKEIWLLNKEISDKNEKPSFFTKFKNKIQNSILEISALVSAIVIIGGPVSNYYDKLYNESKLNFDSQFISILREYQSTSLKSQKSRYLYILSSFDQKELIPLLLNEISPNTNHPDTGQISIGDLITAIKYKIQVCENTNDSKQLETIYKTIYNTINIRLQLIMTNSENLLIDEFYRSKVQSNLKLIVALNLHNKPEFNILLTEFCEYVSKLNISNDDPIRESMQGFCHF